MKNLSVLILVLILGSMAFAKDHSDEYQMGSVSKFTVKDGWVDTTTCSGPSGNVQCAGGISDTYTDVYTFTYNDGTQVVLRHVAFRADTLKTLNLENGSTVKVLYRVERKHGLVSIDYVLIPAADNPKKEGWYYMDGHFKKPTAKATAPAPAPATDQSNLAAMCNSDKLSPELKAQYCK